MNKAKTNDGMDLCTRKCSRQRGNIASILFSWLHQYVGDRWLHPKSNWDYVLVTRNRGQNNKLRELMSKLVFDATDNYVHPTRYRQILETASYRNLISSAQNTISEDQKHSSVVARVHYQKQRSREVANKAREFLERTAWGQGIGARNGRALEALRYVDVFPRAKRYKNVYFFKRRGRNDRRNTAKTSGRRTET